MMMWTFHDSTSFCRHFDARKTNKINFKIKLAIENISNSNDDPNDSMKHIPEQANWVQLVLDKCLLWLHRCWHVLVITLRSWWRVLPFSWRKFRHQHKRRAPNDITNIEIQSPNSNCHQQLWIHLLWTTLLFEFEFKSKIYLLAIELIAVDIENWNVSISKRIDCSCCLIEACCETTDLYKMILYS